MAYLYVWLAVGVVTLVIVLCAHLLARRRAPQPLPEWLYGTPHERKDLSCRVLNDVLAPVLGSLFIVIAWPVAVYMKVKDLWQKKKDDERARGFMVKPADLRERLTLEQIEQREIVEDPLHAVPPLPFGHLHGAWRDFLTRRPEGSELWSFSAQWETAWGAKELREGYVAVQAGRPGAYLTLCAKAVNRTG
jgi:hypothetical protein